MKKLAYLLLFALITNLSSNAQAPKSYTSSEILLQIKKLNTIGSVLYIAAHPDDENTRLIAYLANEKCLRTGYLSLTRGDGGQNLIGPEQGVELGVIRTQELLAARRIDGGEQFFTRAYDFGYSKSPKETFSKWNKDSLLSDMVWVIRNFRPDIIITRFATDGSGGHGHHTASAILAEEAFDAAADPTRFPEQLKYVDVWQTRRMFYNSGARFWNPNADLSSLIKLDVGGYNPLLGKSYGEIAAESRSMHKSQGFGSAKQRGEYFEYFKPLKGDTTRLKDIFEGMDFSWKRVKGGEKIGKMIDKIIKDYKVEKPELSIQNLNEITYHFKSLNNKQLFEFKHKHIENLISICQGQFIELTSQFPLLSIDEKSKITFTLIYRKNSADINMIRPKSNNLLFSFNVLLDSSINVSANQTYKIEKNTSLNSIDKQLFWLDNPINKSLFNPNNYLFRQYPELPLQTTFELSSKNRSQVHNTPIQYKWVDPEKGELYRPLVITPPVMINLAQKSIVFSDNKPKEIKVIVKAGRDSIQTKIKANLPLGWTMQPASATISIAKKGDEQIVTFNINSRTLTSSGVENSTIKFIAEVDGIEYSQGIKEIKYDHIPIQTLFPEAEAKLVRLDVNKKLKRIGYIPGAGDEVQNCLSQLGYEVITITDDILTKENLSQFEAIITGVRAYNTNEKLSTYKQKLMDYVSNGGNLIVQYNTNSFVGPFKGDIGPYPFKITRDRVTDENAVINFELPNHPVLNTPNKITSADFEGWIQERCIYTAGDVDAKYEMPLSMADPDEKANKGSLIIAKHGKGNFIYSGLVFFRELPAGVPGAYRLLVNMIELGK
jgi:LmbE family N-acetylglucosaminyl deacetylase